MVVLLRQVEVRPFPGEAGNDAAVFLGQSRGFECTAELLPFHFRILGQTSLLSVRQTMHGRGQGSDGLFDAFIGRREPEPRVKKFQMRPEFLAQRPGCFGLSGGWLSHRKVMIRYAGSE